MIMLGKFFEAIAVTIHCLIFVTLPFLGSALSIYLFYTPLWPFVIIYLCWMYIDLEISRKGGRRFSAARNSTFARLIQQYFPAEVVKTVDLNPEKNFIAGHHPHGILVHGSFLTYANNGSNFEETFPGITPYCLTMDFFYKIPIIREYGLSMGGASVCRDSITYICTQMGRGNFAAIVPGGAEEAFFAEPGSTRLVIKKRKGMFRLALQTGSDLVPCYCFGENELYKQISGKPGSLLHSFQKRIKKMFGFTPVIFYGAFLILPFRRRLVTVVGSPIEVPKIETPTLEDINKYQELYITGLKKVFNDNKHKYNYNPDAELIIT